MGVALAVGWVIVAGLTHFSAARAFDFPPGAFTLSPAFFMGMGSAMLIATYDYWGYYNVCFLGGEVKDPGRTIPRALIISIVVVAALYLVDERRRARRHSVAGDAVAFRRREQLHHLGLHAAHLRHLGGTARSPGSSCGRHSPRCSRTLLGYSRVPYAAALDGNYFRVFARVDPKRRFPTVSLLALGGVAMLFCFLRLADVIAALVVIRILLQFIVQAVGVMVLRHRRPDMPRPFRMWLYPVPALLAIAGFIFILLARKNFLREIRYAVVIRRDADWRSTWSARGGGASGRSRVRVEPPES